MPQHVRRSEVSFQVSDLRDKLAFELREFFLSLPPLTHRQAGVRPLGHSVQFSVSSEDPVSDGHGVATGVSPGEPHPWPFAWILVSFWCHLFSAEGLPLGGLERFS